MKKISITALLMICSVLFLSACSASFQEEQKAAKKAAETAFTQKPKDANNENEEIDYYLPFGVEVEEESPNNLILKNGSKTYILFYNQNEGKGSKVVYESANFRTKAMRWMNLSNMMADSDLFLLKSWMMTEVN
ncbi:hypothetical protein [Bacillus infantis]|uniref:hypothetical protein n=1 Tax=Bacillus infantis TaxID=324767 RepID=UPI003CF7FC85